jgi:DNA transformation protein and related proteins
MERHMPRENSFVTHVTELLEPLGFVTARRMFGGVGLHRGGQMFGLIIDDRLYFKTDALNRAEFEARGCEPFAYESKRGRVTTSYWTAPEDALDSAELLVPWGRRGMDAAQRAAARKAASTKDAPRKASPRAGTQVKKAPPRKRQAKPEGRSKTRR